MVSTRHSTPVATRDSGVGRTSWVPFGPGMVLGAIATIGVIVAMFMSWRTGDVHPSGVPLAFLFDDSTTSNDPSILLALIPMAVLLGVGTVMPRGNAARAVGALGTIAVVVLFAVQLNNQLDSVPGSNLGDVLETGYYVAAIAGLVGLVSAFMPGWWHRRQAVNDSVVADDRAAYAEDDNFL